MFDWFPKPESAWWNVLSSVGTWFAGLCTLAAVVVSLWLAARQPRPELNVSAEKRIFISGVPTGTPSINPSDFPDTINVTATNTGLVVAKVIGISWVVGFPRILRFAFPKSRAGYQNAPTPDKRSHDIPATLGPSESLDWVLPYEDLVQGLAKNIIAPRKILWRLYLRYLRVQAYTSVGIAFPGRIGRELKDDIGARARVIMRRPPSKS
jgi:hypothetical protein